MKKLWKVAAGAVVILFSGTERTRAARADTKVALYDSANLGVVSRVLNLSLEKGLNRIPLEELAGLDVEEITVRPLNSSVQFLGLYSAQSSEDISIPLAATLRSRRGTGILSKGSSWAWRAESS